jgi:hypothetical protein
MVIDLVEGIPPGPESLGFIVLEQTYVSKENLSNE